MVDERLPNGAAAFGIMMSGYGAGSLIGIILSGLLPNLPQKWFGTILFLAVTLMGVLMAALALVYTLLIGVLLLFLSGLVDGWVIIQFTTWLQRHLPSGHSWHGHKTINNQRLTINENRRLRLQFSVFLFFVNC